jgi:hypothetical protein
MSTEDITESIKGKSRDSRDRLTFDVGRLRERLRAQAIEPNQSLASIVRMALIEWLEQREAVQDEESSEEGDRRKRSQVGRKLSSPDS